MAASGDLGKRTNYLTRVWRINSKMAKSLTQIMRSHSSEKDFSSTLSSVQFVNESTYNFVVRLMSKREKVLILPKEEDCPYDEKLVQRWFLRAISTGIRNNNIVMIFATGSKYVTISEEHLLQHNEKLRQHRKDLKINKTETDKNQENTFLTKLRKMRF